MTRRHFSALVVIGFSVMTSQPACEGVDDVRVVVRIARAHDHRVGPHLVQHRPQVAEQRCVGADERARTLEAQPVDVAKADHVDPVAALGEQLLSPHPGAAMAGAHEGDATLAAGLRGH